MNKPVTQHIRPQLTSGMSLAALPTAVGLALAFAWQRLQQWRLDQLVSDAELVLSELVSNAVNATGISNPTPRWGDLDNLALITVRLIVNADSLVIEVWDRDPNPPVPQAATEVDETGRGLLIVGALCRRWNCFFPQSGGKAVWGELTIPAYGLGPTEPAEQGQAQLTLVGRADGPPSVAVLERVLEGLQRV